MTYNHDGTRLAAAAGNKVLVHDTTDITSAPTILADATDAANVFSIAYNRDSTQLAVGDDAGGFDVPIIRIYDGINPASGEGNFNRIQLGVSGGLYSLAYSPDSHLAIGITGEVRGYNVTNPSSPSLLSSLKDPIGTVRSIIYNHSGTQLVTGDGHGTVRIYDGINPTSDSFQELTDATEPIYSIDYNSNDTRLAVAGRDDRVRIYDGINPTSPPIHVISDATDNVRKVAYDPHGRPAGGRRG